MKLEIIKESPFLLSSLALHFVLLYFLGSLALSVNPDKSSISIPIKLIEFGEGTSRDKSVGPGQGPGGPRTRPKLGNPEIPSQSSGKLHAGSIENTAPSQESTPPPEAAPALPKPKLLAEAAPLRPPAIRETSPDSMVQLPTKEPAAKFSSAVTSEQIQSSLTAKRGTGEGEGVRALREGIQVPGALKGTGTGMGPYGVPGGIREGKGTAGGGTGTGVGGGSYSGLKGTSSTDYDRYFKSIEKRVYSVWKYPDDVTGIQKVVVRFVLDKAGKLTQAEVLDSNDSRINASALEAMRKASPFPPIPDSLKDLAGEPLIIRFTVSIRVKG